MSGGTGDPPADDEVAGLQADLLATKKRAKLGSSKTPSDAENRAWIAQSIINIFLWSIGGIILLLFITAVVMPATDRWKDFAQALLDILKGVLLPVVTLILGYYFGQSSKSGGG